MRTLVYCVAIAASLALVATDATAERRHRGKPSAPVSLTAKAERTASGWHVVVDAAPTRAVDAVTIEIDGQATRFGATAARDARHLVAPVKLDAAAGKDVVVTARVAGRSQSVIVRVGAPAPAAKPLPVTVRQINGVSVAEVRQ
jgi:hypothetical protein